MWPFRRLLPRLELLLELHLIHLNPESKLLAIPLNLQALLSYWLPREPVAGVIITMVFACPCWDRIMNVSVLGPIQP